jgi:phosphatidylglycerol:prolipoprotein diacylglycerol transferase
MIFTKGGFTFYGGLLVAGGGIAYLVRKKGLSIGRFIDALAPTVMLAYGIGRIGCHLAGDGDWGVASNLAAKPGWLPTWLWAETYPKNIIYNTPVPESGYVPLPEAVYPTPLYEFAAAVILFGVLWSLRKHRHAPGWLFSMFLVFAGVERFLIEKIRVNNEFDLLGLTVTQAEVISVILVALGVIGLIKTWKPEASAAAADTAAAPST